MKLSREQQAIIDDRSPHKVVIAAAGSGKTRLLVAQTGRWLAEGADPGSTVVITFTRRAGEELRKRLATEYRQSLGYIGTVHGLAYTAMALSGHPLTPLSDIEADALVDHVAVQARMKSAVCPKVRKVAHGYRLDQVKFTDSGEQALAMMVLSYMASNNLVHVGSLVNRYVSRLNTYLSDLEWLQNRTQTVAWDEFQDTTEDEAWLLNRMDPTRCMTVGDPRQAIFGFRGGSIRHLLERKGTVHTMSTNYRSTPEIVEWANRIDPTWGKMIAFRQSRPGEESPIVEVVPRYVEQTMVQMTVEAASVLPRPLTVLCRTNHELSQVSAELQKFGLKHTISSPGFDGYAEAPWPNLFLACRHVVDRKCEYIATRMRELGLESTRLWSVNPAKAPAGEVLAALSPEDASRMSDDPLLALTVLDFISWYQRRDLECLMPEDRDQSVILMTAHAAKGLEFPSVLLHGVGHRLGGDPADREEMNLLYVAATRAQNCLCVNRGNKLGEVE